MARVLIRKAETILAIRLEALIELRRTNAQQVSLKATENKNPGLVRDILSGKVEQPRSENLKGLAETLETDVGYLLGHHNRHPKASPFIVHGEELAKLQPPKARKGALTNKNPRAPKVTVRNIPIIGAAESGSFRTSPLNWKSTVTIDGALNNLAPHARHFALVVRQHGYTAWTRTDVPVYVLCVDYDAIGVPIASGATYAIQRFRKSVDGKDEFEVSVREAQFVPKGIELTDIDRDAPSDSTIFVDHPLDTDTSKPISILGTAYAISMRLSKHVS